jgi:hypothetical protein
METDAAPDGHLEMDTPNGYVKINDTVAIDPAVWAVDMKTTDGKFIQHLQKITVDVTFCDPNPAILEALMKPLTPPEPPEPKLGSYAQATLDHELYTGTPLENVMKSIEKAAETIKNPPSIVASGGWCAPSETIYDFYQNGLVSSLQMYKEIMGEWQEAHPDLMATWGEKYSAGTHSGGPQPRRNVSSEDVGAVLEEAIPGFHEMTAVHPVQPGCCTGLRQIIICLNDNHKWSREAIADWLETLDLDLTIQPKENAA